MNTTLNIKPNESKCLSLLRCLSVIMIVSCHILQGLGNDWAWIFNIGVQIFFIISGYLYGRKLIEDSISWYKKRSIKILTPYYIYIIFVSIVISIWQPNVFSWKQEALYFADLQGVIGGGYKGLGHLWFLTWIAVCYAITPLIQWSFEDKKWIVFLLILLLGLGCLKKTTCSYVILYILAYLYSRNELISNRNISFFLLCATVFIMAFFSWDKITESKSLYSLLFHIVISSTLVVCMLRFFNHFHKNIKMPKLLKKLDNYSYEIYIVHLLLILGNFSLLTITSNVPFNICLIVLVTIVQAYILKTLARLFTQKILKQY